MGSIKSTDRSHNKNHIDNLNDDCLLKIFSYLPIKDRVRVQRVSVRWRKLSQLQWLNVNTIILNNTLPEPHYNIYNSLSCRKHAEFKRLIELCGRKLESIVLNTKPSQLGCTSINLLNIVNEECKNLKTLSIEQVTISEEGIYYLGQYFSEIENLSIQSWSDGRPIQEYLIGNILSTKRSLKTLKILNDPRMKGTYLSVVPEQIENFFLERTLNLNPIYVVRLLERCKNLRSLVLDTYIRDLNEHVPYRIPNKAGLVILRLGRVTHPTNEISFKGFSNLKVIELHGNIAVNDTTLRSIELNCPKIKRLILEDSMSLTKLGFRCMSRLPEMEILELRKIKGGKIPCRKGSFPNLTCLILSDHHKPSEIKRRLCPFLYNAQNLQLIIGHDLSFLEKDYFERFYKKIIRNQIEYPNRYTYIGKRKTDQRKLEMILRLGYGFCRALIKDPFNDNIDLDTIRHIANHESAGKEKLLFD